jgi:phosphoribosyl 1,2-cyclic phosphodiesterase
MRVTFWGTRGSVATPGPETVRYGGNTSCVAVRTQGDTLIVLDAGTGIRRLGASLGQEIHRIDLLLTHLHMDHIQGLGFFGPLFRPDLEVHIWGPASSTLELRARLSRYLSAPLFPVWLRDLPSPLTLHDVPFGRFDLPGARVTAALVCHPGPTVGYRIEKAGSLMTYMPDHEPALGCPGPFPEAKEWTSGFDLAADADLLVHDAQYTRDEYRDHVGWGHSAIDDAIALAASAGVVHMVPFHHDPTHDDDTLDRIFEAASLDTDLQLTPAREGLDIALGKP